jgi:hypothetical protein
MNEIEILPFIKAFSIVEIMAVPVFYFVRKFFKDPSIKNHNQTTAAIKGSFERLVLVVGLLLGQSSILSFFGALKIATRLDADKSNKISNDYFLTGNLLSILLVLLCSSIFYPYFN